MKLLILKLVCVFKKKFNNCHHVLNAVIKKTYLSLNSLLQKKTIKKIQMQLRKILLNGAKMSFPIN